MANHPESSNNPSEPMANHSKESIHFLLFETLHFYLKLICLFLECTPKSASDDVSQRRNLQLRKKINCDLTPKSFSYVKR